MLGVDAAIEAVVIVQPRSIERRDEREFFPTIHLDEQYVACVMMERSNRPSGSEAAQRPRRNPGWLRV